MTKHSRKERPGNAKARPRLRLLDGMSLRGAIAGLCAGILVLHMLLTAVFVILPAALVEATGTDPRLLPGLVIDVERVLRNGADLGRLELVLTPVSHGLSLDRVRLAGASHTLEARGGWFQETSGEQHGRVSAEVTSSDVAATLEALGYLPGVEARHGRLHADLHWRGAPGAAVANSLGGRASLRLESGSLREVRPGAGRVFGLLSLSALPRRFFLDFRDVFGRGLRFDHLGGDFVLVEGDAYTGNLELRGPAATATIVGRTGLVTRDYDQRVIIDPPVGASLPVAGTLAGGGGVGAAPGGVGGVVGGARGGGGRPGFRL
jgi:uncharacterized protein YhdP